MNVKEESAHELKGVRFCLQVRKAGETVAVAGLATAVFLGIAYMFSGSKKENKNTE